MGAVWGDYDNDGYEDLFLYKWGRPELFHNDAGKGFTRVTEKAGLPAWVNAEHRALVRLRPRRQARHLPRRLLPGGRQPLASQEHEDDAGELRVREEWRAQISFCKARRRHVRGRDERGGIDTRRWALGSAAADLRGTGYPDLFIANDYGVSELFVNDGRGHFREVGAQTGVGFAPKSGMNVSFGDVLNRGAFAVYVSNISEDGVLIQGNNLWVPREGTQGEGLKYENLAEEMGVELGGWSFGAQFGDLNNDGALDLYLTNGYVSLDKGSNYWYDYSKVAGGNTAIISDAANWPPMKGRSLSGYQQKRVWVNDGAGKFADVAQSVGARDTFDGRSVAMADLWNRGVLDVVVANQRGPLLIYKNTVAPENAWVGFELEGTQSNRSAIGAQVRVYWNGQEQVQEVSGGSGFCAQNQRRLHFGLGKNARVERVEIRWPSGKTQTIEKPEIGKMHHVKEAEKRQLSASARQGLHTPNRFVSCAAGFGCKLKADR